MNRPDWCYISGQVIVAESRLLSGDDFLDMLRADSITPMVTRLRQSPIYHGIYGEGDVEGLAGRIESAMVDELRELGRAAPHSGPTDLLLTPYDHQQVRNFVKATVHKRPFEPTEFSELTEEELQASWEDTFEAPPRWADLCRTVRASLAAGGDPNTVIDLIIDHAELACLLELAATTESKMIQQCYADYAAGRTRLALVRARLAELEPEQLRALASTLLPEDELTELIEMPSDRLSAKLLPGSSGSDDASESLTRFALGIDNEQTRRVREARGIVFGPERLFEYAWGLAMECLNLKLISETKLLAAPAQMTEWRLRESYV